MEYKLNISELEKSVIDIEKYFSSITINICDSPKARKSPPPIGLGYLTKATASDYDVPGTGTCSETIANESVLEGHKDGIPVHPIGKETDYIVDTPLPNICDTSFVKEGTPLFDVCDDVSRDTQSVGHTSRKCVPSTTDNKTVDHLNDQCVSFLDVQETDKTHDNLIQQSIITISKQNDLSSQTCATSSGKQYLNKQDDNAHNLIPKHTEKQHTGAKEALCCTNDINNNIVCDNSEERITIEKGRNEGDNNMVEHHNVDNPQISVNVDFLKKLSVSYRVCCCMDPSLSYVEDRDIKVSENSQKISVTFSHEPNDGSEEEDAIPEEDLPTVCTVYALHRSVIIVK